MIARDICPIHAGIPRAALQTIPDAPPLAEHNTLPQWLFYNGPLILGSAIGMFTSNIFLYAFRNGGLRATARVSPHFLSSLPGRIHQVATAALRSVHRSYLWTSQLSRHIYLLALCAFCQAVILPCLVVSQLLGWAGLAWFGSLRVLYSAIRIVSRVVFELLVVDTGLGSTFIVASNAAASCSRWMWDSTTDLHDAAVAFVGETNSIPPSQSLVSALLSREIFLKDSTLRSQDPTNERQEDSSSASLWCLTGLTAHRSTGTPQASVHPRFNPVPTKTNKGVTSVDFVIGYEVDVTHEGAHCRFPIHTTVRLHIALSDQLHSRIIDRSESPTEVDVTRPNEINDVRNRFGDRDPGNDVGSIEARKDIPENGRIQPREEAVEEEGERLAKGQSTIPMLRINRRYSGWARQDDSPLLRSPPVTSPAFWCPPGADTPESVCGPLP